MMMIVLLVMPIISHQMCMAFGHNPYYRNVIDVLLGKDVPSTDGRDGQQKNHSGNHSVIYRSAKPENAFLYLIE